MLHAWKKYGIESTAQNYYENHTGEKYSNPQVYRPPIQKVVFGKINFVGMVKGKNNPVYLGLLREFIRLAPDYVKVDYKDNLTILPVTKPYIYTEGKTDRKHLIAALRYFKSQGLFPNLEFDFPQGENDEGDTLLLQKLRVTETQPEPHTRPHIFIFDRDNSQIIKNIEGSNEFTTWKNKVYSLALPIPKHREDIKEICIEFYYKDDDIVKRDENGRRLYLSREFNATSGMHLEEDNLMCKKYDKLKGELKILDDLILDRAGNNVALSKSKFAENILNESSGFTNIDFSGFKPLF